MDAEARALKTNPVRLEARLLAFFLLVFACAQGLQAAPKLTTYQAKIIKPDGQPLESNGVNFRFTIMDPAGTCILFTENYSSINMAGTGGLISFSLGSGIKSFPLTATTFTDVFDNTATALACQPTGSAPPSYTPLPTDVRKIVMQFQDSSGWQTLPAMSINSVPYASYASKAVEAQRLNGKLDSDFAPSAGLQDCAPGFALTFNNASFGCVVMPSGGSGSGTATLSVSATAPLVVTGSVSSPVISMTVASVSADGYITSVDYAEFKGKLSASPAAISSVLGYTPLSASATLSGDVSGLISSTVVDSVGGKTSTQVALTVDAVAAATASSTVDTLVKRDASGNVNFNVVSADISRSNYFDLYKPSSNFNVRLQAPTSLSSNYTLTFPENAGSSGQVLQTDGSGNLTWVNQSGVSGLFGTANEVVVSGAASKTISLADIGTAGVYYKVTTDSKGRVVSGVSSLTLADLPASVLSNLSAFGGDVSGQLSNISVDRIKGVSVTITSLSTNQILQFDGNAFVNRTIPTCGSGEYLTFNGTTYSCASSAAPSSGTLTSVSSSNSYITVNNATTAPVLTLNVGTTSSSVAAGNDARLVGALQSANNLSDVASAAAARINLGLGSLSTLNSVDLSGPAATGIIADARLANQAGVASGTQYTKVTVDGKGRVTSAAQLSNADVVAALGYTPANTASAGAYLQVSNNLSDLASSATARTNLGLGTAAVLNVGTGANNILQLNGSSQIPAVNGSLLTNLNATNITAGTLNAARLPSFNGDITIAAGSSTATVTRLQGRSVLATAPASGQVLSFNGTAWAPYTVPAGNVGTVTSITAGTGLLGGTITSAGTISLSNTGVLANTYAKVTVDLQGRVTSGSALNSADVTTALGYTPASATSLGNYLVKTNNLSDLASSATARTNLGLAALATKASVDLSTADATGILAIARLPSFSGDVSSVSGSNSLILSNSGVTASTYAKVTVDAKGRVTSGSALNSADVTTALGYTPASATSLGNYLVKTNNLSDLASSATARTNLGLGTAAVLNVGTGANNILQLNGSSQIPAVNGSLLTNLNATNITAGTLDAARLPSFNGDITIAAGSSTATVTRLQGRSVVATAPTSGQVLSFNGTSWAPYTVPAGNVGTVTSITAGTGLLGGTITSAGTISLSNTGVLANTYTKVTVDLQGRVTSGASLNSSDVTTALGYTPASSTALGNYVLRANNLSDLASSSTARTNLGLGTAAVLNVGTGANNILQLNGSSQIPAVNGSLLTNLNATNLATGTLNAARLPSFNGDITIAAGSSTATVTRLQGRSVVVTAPASGQVLKFNGTAWAPATDTAGTGTVTNVSSANADIAVATGTTTPVLTLNVGTAANQIVKLNASAQLPAVNGSLLTALNGTNITTGTVNAARLPAYTGDVTKAAGSSSLVLANSGVTASTYAKVTVDAKGRVTSGSALNSADVTTALGYTPASATSLGNYLVKTNNLSDLTSSATARTNLGLGTAAVLNVGTGANNILQLNGSSQIPAVNGSLLTNLNATNITAGTLNAARLPSFNGDITIAAGSSTATVTRLQGRSVVTTAPTTGQVLKFNGTAWAPATDTAGTGTVTNVSSANADIAIASGTTTPVLTLNVGTTANKILKLDASARIPAVNGSLLTALNGTNITTGTLNAARLPSFNGDITIAAGSSTATVTRLQGRSVVTTAPTTGQVLKFNGTAWAPATDTAGTGTVTNVSSANADIAIASGTTTPVLTLNVGTTASKILKLDASARIPAVNGSLLTALNGTNITTGTVAAARLPAYSGDVVKAAGAATFTVDGIQGRAVAATVPTTGQVLAYNGTSWAPATNVSSQWTTLGATINYTAGNVGVGTTAPGANTRLRVSGQMAPTSFSTTGNAINWTSGNTATTSYDCALGSISFSNMNDGGAYTLAVTSTTTAQCNFGTAITGDGAATVAYRFLPANAARTASSHSIYSFQRIGNVIYVSWLTGF